MTRTIRNSLLERLVELCHLYPEMRVGQLFAFLGSMAGKDTTGLCRDFTDATLLQVAERHVERRAQQLGLEANHDLLSLPAQRQKALKGLAACDQRVTLPLGQLVHELAAASNVTEYDLEDDQLEEAIRKVDADHRIFVNTTE